MSHVPAADARAALAMARAAVRALIAISPDSAAQVRAQLRKEAIGLETNGGADDLAAAAIIRTLLD